MWWPELVQTWDEEGGFFDSLEALQWVNSWLRGYGSKICLSPNRGACMCFLLQGFSWHHCHRTEAKGGESVLPFLSLTGLSCGNSGTWCSDVSCQRKGDGARI
jgi:hypothetical protein